MNPTRRTCSIHLDFEATCKYKYKNQASLQKKLNPREGMEYLVDKIAEATIVLEASV